MNQKQIAEFEHAHPEYERLFPMIMKEINDVSMEELGKAFQAINARMKERSEEINEKYHVSAVVVREMNEILTSLMKQVDSDVRQSISCRSSVPCRGS